MLVLDNVSISTREVILDKASISFIPGKIYGLVAPNGSGKTTLFRTIAQLYPPLKGQILLDKSKKYQHKIFYLEDNNWLDRNLNRLDYLQLVKKL